MSDMINQNNETQPVTYTEEQLRTAYNEGQKTGFTAAVRQVRSAINDYLNDLIVSAELNGQQK